MNAAVDGYCPACGARSLFLAEGGHVTCAIDRCPEPTRAGAVLNDPSRRPDRHTMSGLIGRTIIDAYRVGDLLEMILTGGDDPWPLAHGVELGPGRGHYLLPVNAGELAGARQAAVRGTRRSSS